MCGTQITKSVLYVLVGLGWRIAGGVMRYLLWIRLTLVLVCTCQTHNNNIMRLTQQACSSVQTNRQLISHKRRCEFGSSSLLVLIYIRVNACACVSLIKAVISSNLTMYNYIDYYKNLCWREDVKGGYIKIETNCYLIIMKPHHQNNGKLGDVV